MQQPGDLAIYCLLCQQSLNSGSQYLDHVVGKEHFKKLRKQIEDGSLFRVPEDTHSLLQYYFFIRKSDLNDAWRTWTCRRRECGVLCHTVEAAYVHVTRCYAIDISSRQACNDSLRFSQAAVKGCEKYSSSEACSFLGCSGPAILMAECQVCKGVTNFCMNHPLCFMCGNWFREVSLDIDAICTHGRCCPRSICARCHAEEEEEAIQTMTTARSSWDWCQ